MINLQKSTDNNLIIHKFLQVFIRKSKSRLIITQIRARAAELGESEAVAIVWLVKPEPQEDEVEPEQEETATANNVEKYLDLECLQQALNGDAPELSVIG